MGHSDRFRLMSFNRVLEPVDLGLASAVVALLISAAWIISYR